MIARPASPSRPHPRATPFSMTNIPYFPRILTALSLNGIACASAMLSASPLSAQSAQPYSLQVAASYATLHSGGRSIAGFGIAPQLRFNRVLSTENLGTISLGVGGEYSLHRTGGDRLQVAGLFVEPRWALPFSAGCAFPFVAARAAVQRVFADFATRADGSASGYAVGAGPGVTFRMTRTANLDVGVQLQRQEFRSIRGTPFTPSTTFAARVGISLGYSR